MSHLIHTYLLYEEAIDYFPPLSLTFRLQCLNRYSRYINNAISASPYFEERFTSPIFVFHWATIWVIESTRLLILPRDDTRARSRDLSNAIPEMCRRGYWRRHPRVLPRWTRVIMALRIIRAPIISHRTADWQHCTR